MNTNQSAINLATNIIDVPFPENFAREDGIPYMKLHLSCWHDK